MSQPRKTLIELIALVVAMVATALPALAAEKPAADKPALPPHPVVKTFYITGVQSEDDVKKITDALMKVPSVTAVTDLSVSSGHVNVAFDTHKIAAGLVAQALMDQGSPKVWQTFEVPEYAHNAEKLDALFKKVEAERSVKIAPTDKAKGEFILTYEPIKPDPSDPRKVGFNFGYLAHPIGDPAPKGMALEFKAPDLVAAAKPAAKKKDAK